MCVLRTVATTSSHNRFDPVPQMPPRPVENALRFVPGMVCLCHPISLKLVSATSRARYPAVVEIALAESEL